MGNKTAHVPAGHANGGQFTGGTNAPKRQRKAKARAPTAPRDLVPIAVPSQSRPLEKGLDGELNAYGLRTLYGSKHLRDAYEGYTLATLKEHAREVQKRNPGTAPRSWSNKQDVTDYIVGILNGNPSPASKARKAMPRKNAASTLPAPAPVKRARKRIKTVKLTGDPFTAIRRALTVEANRKKRKAAPVHRRATALRNDPAFMAQLAARRPRAIKAAQREVRMVTGAKRFSKGLMKSEKGLNYPYHKEYRRALARGTTQKLRAPRKKKSA